MCHRKQASNLTSTILSLRDQNNQRFSQVLARLEEQAQSQQREHQGHHEFLSDLSSRLLAAIEEGKRAALNQEIISSLWFKTLKYREDDVVQAYGDTIGWLFDPNETPFCRWLESREGIFWISGLAGSGKSTLMKFAIRNEKTTQMLSKWASGRQLHVAHFFFWNSGFDMQKSQRGLLQSLLVQICRIQPDLVTSLCPDHKPNEPWGVGELKVAFSKLQDESLSSLAFCFFIDGLDEYDGVESEIIDVLQSLSKVSHVKICASSRPWTAFNKAFTDTGKKLFVQRHTLEDMKIYVHGMLEENVDFQRLAAEDSRCLSLVPEIADRANGVWLWVYLVVKDLTRDIEGNENYDFLKRRLDAVPSGLEKYFEKIMSRIDDIHKEETAQIFLLIIESVQPPPLLTFELLRTERRDPDFALDEEFQYVPLDEVKRMCDGWIPKIWNRCGDLLIVRIDDTEDYLFRWRVEFLHRTVGDWLRESHQDALRKSASQAFDATMTLCRISFAFARLSIEWIQKYYAPLWYCNPVARELTRNVISEFGIYAFNLQERGKDEVTFKYIAALDSVLERRTILSRASRDIWRAFCDDIDDSHPTFLGVVVHLGLSRYAQHDLSKDPRMLKKQGRPLLSFSLWPGYLEDPRKYGSQARSFRQADMELVKFLLCHGADPNEIVPNSDQSVLYEFAHRLFKNNIQLSQSEQQSIFSIVELLVQHGGNMQFEAEDIMETAYNPMLAQDKFETLFTPHQMNRLRTIGNIKKRPRKWWSRPLFWK
jgi:hypothetical protein